MALQMMAPQATAGLCYVTLRLQGFRGLVLQSRGALSSKGNTIRDCGRFRLRLCFSLPCSFRAIMSAPFVNQIPGDVVRMIEDLQKNGETYAHSPHILAYKSCFFCVEAAACSILEPL